MKTKMWEVNPTDPEPDIISKAAALLENWELVAFPTETVYGLGAMASASEAVQKIFIAKGRPAQNPLLVHVSNMEQVQSLVKEIPDTAKLLMDKFWPGPLSLILPAREEVPSIVRGGKSTVGIRMPSHPVALALIDKAGPIAAPSANLSGRPSPLNAFHVKADLDGKIAAILDAGNTGIGLESTLLEFCNGYYRILRLGGLPLTGLQAVLGDNLIIESNESDKLPHYQTTCQVIICKDEQEFVEYQRNYLKQNQNFAIVLNKIKNHIINHSVPVYDLSMDNQHSELYSILRAAENYGCEFLLFAPLPKDLEKVNPALLDRIIKASKRVSS